MVDLEEKVTDEWDDQSDSALPLELQPVENSGRAGGTRTHNLSIRFDVLQSGSRSYEQVTKG